MSVKHYVEFRCDGKGDGDDHCPTMQFSRTGREARASAADAGGTRPKPGPDLCRDCSAVSSDKPKRSSR
jgi:hypothetical protein